jgi:hypothetical protein
MCDQLPILRPFPYSSSVSTCQHLRSSKSKTLVTKKQTPRVLETETLLYSDSEMGEPMRGNPNQTKPPRLPSFLPSSKLFTSSTLSTLYPPTVTSRPLFLMCNDNSTLTHSHSCHLLTHSLTSSIIGTAIEETGLDPVSALPSTSR